MSVKNFIQGLIELLSLDMVVLLGMVALFSVSIFNTHGGKYKSHVLFPEAITSSQHNESVVLFPIHVLQLSQTESQQTISLHTPSTKEILQHIKTQQNNSIGYFITNITGYWLL